MDCVSLSEGSGGKEMLELIKQMRKKLSLGKWRNSMDDSASIDFKGKLLFTTDSYVVTPLFFPGGNIGKIAFCGTVNDLAVMGAKPIGISLGMVVEEGFPKKDLFRIIDSIAELSDETGIPIATGDFKVMEKGSVDKIIINTSGIGKAEKTLDLQAAEGDKIIVSGGIGEHAAALLAERFDLKTEIKTDSRPLWNEIKAIKNNVKQAKDITRGGLAAVLNEIADKNKKQVFVEEEKIPVKKGVSTLTNLLGIEAYVLACEGRLVCICGEKKAGKVLKALKKFNSMAAEIGEIRNGSGVKVQTRYGQKTLKPPSGKIVPRIC